MLPRFPCYRYQANCQTTCLLLCRGRRRAAVERLTDGETGAVFTRLDTDGSGAMEAGEVYEAAQVMGLTDMTEEAVAAWIKEHDEVRDS